MLASIKSSLKSFGNKSIDTHVRPPVHSRATQELEHVRAQLIARLPQELKQRTIEAARDYVEGDDGAGMSALVAKFIRRNLLDSPDGGKKLDEVIAKVTEQLAPKIIEASDHLDERATEAAVRELKEALHLIPDSGADGESKRDRALQEDLDRALDEPEEDPVMTQQLARFWPALTPAAESAPRGERLAFKTRALVRKLTAKILPKIMRSVPDILQNALLALVEKEVREEFDELRSSKWSGAWLDKVFDKAEDKAVKMQRKLMDSFMDTVWEKGVRDKCTEEAVELLVEFEVKVAGEVRGVADKLPF